jgi:uncharacterized RDD family membrane protein YckC
MVLDDQSSSSYQVLAPMEERYATPVDRLLAKFFDFVFLAPVLALLTEFTKYLFIQNKFFIDDTRFVSFLNFQLAVVIVFIYHLVSVYKFQATIGQQILKMKIIKADGSRLTYQDVWIRQLSWFLNFVFLGFPFLEILAHKKRQSIHDRLSETIVVTETKIYSSSHILEVDLVKTTYKLGSVFVALLILAVNFYFYETFRQNRFSSKLDSQCFDFQDESKSFLDLDKKLSAYYVGLGSKDCVVQSLAQELIKKDLDQDLIQLAQYFLHTEDKRIQKTYRDNLCKTDCRWLDQGGDLVQKKLPLFSKIYKYKNSEYQSLDQRIANISNLKLPAEFNGLLFEDLINKEKKLSAVRSPASEKR